MELLPEWVDDDGFPRSWRHYVYGMSYLERANARWMIDLAAATRAGALGKEKAYQAWRRDLKRRAR